MARRRRKYTNKPKRKSSAPRAKPIRLDPDVWLRSPKSIADYRESLLVEQEYKCAISFLPLTKDNSCLDHKHIGSCEKVYQDEGKIRGVLEPQINLIEGQFLKLFKRSKLYEKYGLNFSDVLIRMGEYLQQDNSSNPYHKEVITTYRKQIQRLTKQELVDKIFNDFQKLADVTDRKEELVHKCCTYFVELIETRGRNFGKNKDW